MLSPHGQDSHHGVEEELGGRQSGVETVFDESFGRRNLRVSLEVRQGPILEPVGDSLPVQGLLADASDHLGDVDERTLRPGNRETMIDPKGFHDTRSRIGSIEEATEYLTLDSNPTRYYDGGSG